MTDRPILFSGPMVRAIIEGRKTQTRRPVTTRNTMVNGHAWSRLTREQQWDWAAASVDGGPSPAGNPGPYLHLPWLAGASDPFESTVQRIYPKVQPGDRLWVRETWCPVDDRHFGSGQWIDYRATPRYEASYPAGWENDPDSPEWLKWRPSIFMPRAASRLTLVVTDVRLQRLRDISEDDAQAEGVFVPEAQFANQGSCAPILAFFGLWESINGKRHGCTWNDNPWVVAITFKPHQCNIDKMPEAS
ncbi:MAG TPA: hypothetical protein PLJ34_05450 [Hyphomicrobiales bacterium]|nr:hypothetical protein [Hyphomicrobiales bacterium]